MRGYFRAFYAETTNTRGAGVAAMRARLKAGLSEVLAGIPSDATEPDGTSTATVAYAHEFGVPAHNLPERSFLRAAIRRNRELFRAMNADSLRRCLAGHNTIRWALERLGRTTVQAIKDEIRRGDFEPLMPETAQRKGNDRPLIESSTMLNSVAYEIPGGGA